MWLVRPLWFPLLCFLIVSVSLYDTFLIIKYSEPLRQMEENPVGRWLIAVGDGQVGIFVRVKLAGTLIVMTVLTVLQRIRSRKTLPVTTSLAAYQTGLFTYLTFF